MPNNDNPSLFLAVFSRLNDDAPQFFRIGRQGPKEPCQKNLLQAITRQPAGGAASHPEQVGEDLRAFYGFPDAPVYYPVSRLFMKLHSMFVWNEIEFLRCIRDIRFLGMHPRWLFQG